MKYLSLSFAITVIIILAIVAIMLWPLIATSILVFILLWAAIHGIIEKQN
jgi:hypothetical protein